MALRNRSNGFIKTGYSHNCFQTPSRLVNQDLSPFHHTGIEVHPHTTTHAPEIVFNSLYTERLQTLNDKNFKRMDDSIAKAMHTRGMTSIDMGTIAQIEEEEEETSAQPVQLTGCEFTNTEVIFCRLVNCLIQNDEKLLKAKNDFLDIKFDVEKRLNLTSKFSPISMFQRIDRPGKGHITRQEMLKFLAENGHVEGQGFEAKDLGLVMKKKMDYQG